MFVIDVNFGSDDGRHAGSNTARDFANSVRKQYPAVGVVKRGAEVRVVCEDKTLIPWLMTRALGQNRILSYNFTFRVYQRFDEAWLDRQVKSGDASQ